MLLNPPPQQGGKVGILNEEVAGGIVGMLPELAMVTGGMVGMPCGKGVSTAPSVEFCVS